MLRLPNLPQSDTSQLHQRHLIWLLILLLPITAYFLLVFQFSINIPISDDYDIIFHYLNAPADRKWDMVWGLHNEHRLIFSRLVSDLVYHLFGVVDFRLLIAIGNLSLFGIFLILYRQFIQLDCNFKYFLPVPFALFMHPILGNAMWASTALQSYGVILFALLSFHFFNDRNRKGLPLSLLFCALAVGSSGSGVLAVLTLVTWSFVNVLNHRFGPNPHASRRKSDAFRLVAVLLFSSLVLGLYFHGYSKPGHHPPVLDALLNPVRTAHYFLGFLGSFAPARLLAPVLGLSVAAWFVLVTVKKLYESSPVIYYSLLFLIFNAGAAALTRSAFGLGQALSFRYSIISALALILLYFSAIRLATFGKDLFAKALNIILILSVLLCPLSFVAQFVMLSERNIELSQGIENWKNFGVGLKHGDQARAGASLSKAIEKGYYSLPDG
jgi:hypothetical protein